MRALDLGLDRDPAGFAVARPDDAVLGAVFGRAAMHRGDEIAYRRFAILWMDAPDPIFVRLVCGLSRKSVNAQIFGRAAVLEALSQIDLNAADLPDLLYAREFGLAVAQRTFGPNTAGRFDSRDQQAADAGRRRLVRHRRVTYGEIRKIGRAHV